MIAARTREVLDVRGDESAGGEAKFVEVQGTAEGMAFSRSQLDSMLILAEGGLDRIADEQAALIATPPAARPTA